MVLQFHLPRRADHGVKVVDNRNGASPSLLGEVLTR